MCATMNKEYKCKCRIVVTPYKAFLWLLWIGGFLVAAGNHDSESMLPNFCGLAVFALAAALLHKNDNKSKKDRK